MEWIAVQVTTQDLLRAEERLALALCNLVPHSPDAQSERLNRFREDRDMGFADGKGGGRHYSDDDEDEDAMHSQENPEESTCESDREGEEDNF